MHFKTHQALALAEISEEKLRHWKKELTPLRNFDGRREGFSFEQVVALAVINRIVGRLKVPITALSPHADEIFEVVADLLRSSGPEYLYILGDRIAYGGKRDIPEAEVLIQIHLVGVAERVRAAAVGVTEPQLGLDLDVKPVAQMHRPITAGS